MRKFDEMTKKDSCLKRAHEDEWLFVLLGRDVAAPETIRFWVQERIRLGKNVQGDAQMREALDVAVMMEAKHS